MASPVAVTQQISRNQQITPHQYQPGVDITAARDCVLYTRCGHPLRFGALTRDRKTILVFVRSFLCYTSKEYVEDLAKIPSSFLEDAAVRLVVIGQAEHCHIEPFCALTGYPYDIYVDPERRVYQKLGMRRGETPVYSDSTSPHIKSSTLTGSVKSIWWAMTSPAFDFQGDPQQQGGALVVGPGSEVHFAHFNMNRLDQTPIAWLLQLAGVQTVDFSGQPKIIHI